MKRWSRSVVVRAVGVVMWSMIMSTAAGCSCGPSISNRLPEIEVLDDMGLARSSVDFGKVQLQSTATLPIKIRNPGSGTLTISTTTFSNMRFGVGETLPVSISPGESMEFKLTFTPVDADVRVTGTVTISSDASNTPELQLSLGGTGVEAVAVVVPNPISLGDVYVGESKSVDVTVTNTGTNVLTFTDAAFSSTVPPQITADLSKLKVTLQAGQSATTSISFAPLAAGDVAGSLKLTPAMGVATEVPLTARAIQAIPRACFKFDNSGFETCTDATTTSLNIVFGSLCDARIFPPTGGSSPCVALDGGSAPYSRGGQLYLRNEGNVPVQYSMQFQAQAGSTCDAGSSIDFAFSNAPMLPDGGTQATWNVATTGLPMMVTAPKPWETAPITVSYNARSACPNDAADQARMLWTRQGDTGRQPQTIFLTFTGQSLLPRGVSSDISMMGSVPQSVPIKGALNAGDAPLRMTRVALYQAEFLLDGGRGTVPFEECDGTAAGDCRFFGLKALDGGSINAQMPFSLPGTPQPTQPTSANIGTVTFGASDAGVLPLQNVEYRVFCVVESDTDPYSPNVVSSIRGRRTQ